MNANVIARTCSIVLMFLSSSLYSQTEDTVVTVKRDGRTQPQDRATIIFHILNQAGIKHEQTRVNAYEHIEQGDKAGARYVCNTFIAEIDGVCDLLKELTTLNREDVEYVANSLRTMQKDIKQLLSDMPFLN